MCDDRQLAAIVEFRTCGDPGPRDLLHIVAALERGEQRAQCVLAWIIHEDAP